MLFPVLCSEVQAGFLSRPVCPSCLLQTSFIVTASEPRFKQKMAYSPGQFTQRLAAEWGSPHPVDYKLYAFPEQPAREKYNGVPMVCSLEHLVQHGSIPCSQRSSATIPRTIIREVLPFD